MLPCLLGATALAPLASNVLHADGRSYNKVGGPMDWLMVEERRPYFSAGNWSPFLDRSIVSDEGASFFFYTGFGNGGGPTSGWWHWSTWPVENPITPGDALKIKHLGSVTSGHDGNGGEGTSAGMTGGPVFGIQAGPDAWYRFAVRVWRPTDGTPRKGYAGQWIRECTTGRWYHCGTYETPFSPQGVNSFGGFIEGLGHGAKRIDFRNAYYRIYGESTVRAAKTINVSWNGLNPNWAGWIGGYADLIEDNAVARAEAWDGVTTNPLGYYYDPNVVGTTKSLTMTAQPDLPTFDPIVVSSGSASVLGNQLVVQWASPDTSSPQLAYTIEVFDNAAYSGTPAMTAYDRDPVARQCLVDITGIATPYVRLRITDIFDNVGPNVDITPVAATPRDANSVPGAVNGLDYDYYVTQSYYDAGTGTTVTESFTALPDYQYLPDGTTPRTVTKTGALDYIDLTPRTKRAGYAFDYTGYISVPTDGIYSFTLTSFDSSKLTIGTTEVIDFNGMHQRASKSGWIALKAGLHPVRVQYAFAYQRGQTTYWDDVKLEYSGPGIAFQEVPASAWYRVPASGEPEVVLATPAAGVPVLGDSVPLSVSVTPNGNTVSKVQYYVGDVFYGESSTGPDYRVDAFMGEAPHNKVRARLFHGANQTKDSAPQTDMRTVNPIVAPWTLKAIGQQHMHPTGAKIGDNRISIKGDNFNVIYREVTGDCTFVARLADITSSAPLADGTSPDGSAKAGIMLRASLEVDNGNPMGGNFDYTRYAAVFGQINGGTYYQDTTMRGGNGAPDRTSANLGGSNKWLRLQRTGDTFVTSISVDGSNWTQVNTVTIAGIGAKLYACVFQFTSWNMLPYIPHASFDNVSLVGDVSGALTVSASPVDETRYEGQSVTFRASPVGKGPFTYQWMKDGVDIPGSTGETHVVAGIVSTDAGLYSVRVGNGTSTVASDGCRLRVRLRGGYADYVLGQSPLGYWRLDETSGPTLTDAMGMRDATGSGVTYGVAPAAKTGFETTSKALGFGGASVSSSVSIPALNLNSNTATFTAWVKRSGTQPEWAGIVFTRDGSNAGLQFGYSNELRYMWNNNFYGWSSGLVPPDGEWTFVALVIEPTKATVHMIKSDGTHTSKSNTATHSPDSLSGVTKLGWDTNQSYRRFIGSMDEVAIFNRALTFAELDTLFAASSIAKPEVALTSPVDGTQTAAPASFTLSASVVPNGVTVDKVQFYDGSTFIGEDATAPYGLSWNNVQAGAHSVTARMIYNTSSTLASSPVFVTVHAEPPAPADFTASLVGDSVVKLAWTVSDEAETYGIYRNGVLVGTVFGTTYVDVGLAASTTYAYTVRATGEYGTSVDSATVSVTTGAAMGTTLVWDADSETVGPQDGVGYWDAASANWWDGSGNVAWAENAVAVFGASTTDYCQVNLTRGVTPSGIVFACGNYYIDSLGGSMPVASVLRLTSESLGTVAAPISGAGSVVKDGPGKVTLAASSTYAGGTTIAAGTLQFNVSSSSSNMGGTIANNGTLVFNVTTGVTNANAISGTGSLIKSGGSQLTMTGAHTYTGGTVVNGGTLSTNVSTAAGAKNVFGGGLITVNGGARIQFYTASTGNQMSYANPIALNGGTLVSNDGVVTYGGPVTLTGNNTVDVVWGGKNAIFSNVVGGTGGIVKTGSGSVILTGANTFTGDVAISASTFEVRGSLGAGSYAGGIANSGSFVINTSSAQVLSGVVSGSGSLAKSGTGTLTLSGANTYTGATTVSGGTLAITGQLGTGTYAGSIANGATVVLGGAADQEFSGVLSGAGTWNKTGSGLLTLSGAGTATGSFNASSGIVVVTGSLASASMTVGQDATLKGTGTVGAATIEGTLAPGLDGIGTLTANGSLAMGATGRVAIDIGKSGTTCSADLVSGTGAMAFGGTLAVTATGDALAVGDSFQLFAKESYSGSFTTLELPVLDEALMWNVTGLATTGTIAVVVKTVTAAPAATTSAATSVGSTTATVNGVVVANNLATSVSFEYGTTTAYGSTATATPGTATGYGDTSVTADLTGLSGVTTYHFRVKAVNSKGTAYGEDMTFTTEAATGNGVWTNLAGGSWPTYGNWSGNVVGGGAGNTADFSTLDLAADATVTLDGARTIGNLVFGDATTATNNWTLSTGTGGPLTLSTIAGTPAVTVNNQTATIGAVLAGTQGFTKSGTGLLVLSGANTNSGEIVVSTGTLRVGNASALGSTAGGTTVAAGATLDLNGQALAAGEFITLSGTGVSGSALIGAGSVNGTLSLAADATIGSPGNLQVGTAAAPRTITGAHTLTKTGTGSLWYRGPADGAGNSLAAVVVNQGTFGVEANDNALNLVPVTVNPGATFSSWANAGSQATTQNNPITLAGGTLGSDFDGQTYSGPVTLSANSTLGGGAGKSCTVSGAITGSTYGLTKATTATVTLTGACAYTGATTISSGTLAFGGTGTIGNVACNAALSVTGTGNIATGAITNPSTSGSLNVATGGVLSATTYTASWNPSSFTVNGTMNLSGLLTFSVNATRGISGTGTINAKGVSNTNYTYTTFNAQTLNIGSSGISVGSGSLTLNGTKVGATADWSSGSALILAGAPEFNTLDAADGTTGRTITLSGVLSGTGAPTKAGAGTLTLTGANTYTGATTVAGGTLKVNGSLAAGSAVTVGASGTLAGSGTVGGAATVDGMLAPGATTVGRLTLGTSTALGATGVLSADIVANSAATAGTHFDQLVTPTLSVAPGAKVNLVLNAAGSTVDFTNAFWDTAQRFKVASTTATVTSAPALGTVSADSLGASSATQGSFSIEIAADGLGIEAVWTPLVLTPVQTWRETWFGTTENSGSAANDADPDGDGRSNLLEYAIGANPTVADARTGITSKVQVYAGDGLKHLNAIVSVNAAATDVTVSVEFASSTSGPWTNVTTYTTDAQGRHVYTDPVVSTPGSPRFFRVVVTPL